VKQAAVDLGFSNITAPSTGEVIKRMVEPGDMAVPGKPLLVIRTQSGFRIEAHVREGLINTIRPNQTLQAEIPTLNAVCNAEVEEIIPYADPETRTFLVKASLPVIDGLYPGMYGKLLVPESSKKVILIPADAVVRTGQLELVMVKNNSSWRLRYVKTGKSRGTMIEILSGISDKEIVGLGEAD